MNVFAGIGSPDPDVHFIKAQLMGHVQDVIRRRKLDQAEAARLTGVNALELSKMLNGQFRETSIEEIIRLLTKLGCAIDVAVKPHGRMCPTARN
ncbi:MAG: XRE family transcriptional regulator [Deltaproteobacteria bacterium]|nr:XRE family transcriptional regulator [Deltaproteobacteria bacterium]